VTLSLPEFFTLRPAPRTILTSTSGTAEDLKVFRCNVTVVTHMQGVFIQFVLSYISFIYRGFFGFFLFMYVVELCFICRPSDSTVSEDAGI
jgi:hypothetical protein